MASITIEFCASCCAPAPCDAYDPTLSATIGGSPACVCELTSEGYNSSTTFTGIVGTFTLTLSGEDWESDEIGVITVDKYVENSDCGEAAYLSTDIRRVKLALGCSDSDGALTLLAIADTNGDGVYLTIGSAPVVLDTPTTMTIGTLCGDITVLVE